VVADAAAVAETAAAAAEAAAAAMGEPDAVVKAAALLLGEGLPAEAVDGLLPAAASCCWGLISFPGELMVDYERMLSIVWQLNQTK